jgi:hypothetical protein
MNYIWEACGLEILPVLKNDAELKALGLWSVGPPTQSNHGKIHSPSHWANSSKYHNKTQITH